MSYLERRINIVMIKSGLVGEGRRAIISAILDINMDTPEREDIDTCIENCDISSLYRLFEGSNYFHGFLDSLNVNDHILYCAPDIANSNPDYMKVVNELEVIKKLLKSAL